MEPNHSAHHIQTVAETASPGGLFDFLSQSGFMPHGHCYLWRPSLVWTHVLSDLLIGFAYVSISLTLYALVRKIRLPFSSMVLSFGVFIGACGATHFMEVWNLWNADYWAGGLVKVLTAVASVATGIWLVKLRPSILAVADSVKLVARQKIDLEELNRSLEEQVRQRTLEATQREKEFQTLADTIPQLAWMAEADGSVFWYNRRWYEYTGTDLASMKGWGWQQVHHKEHLAAVTSRWEDSLRRGQVWEMEFPLRRSDGTYRWFLTRAIPLKDESGAVVRWFGTNTDIHEKKMAEERVLESSEHFRVITEAIPQLVWRCDPDGSADYFSHAFLEFVGYGAEEMLGWGWSEVIHTEDRARVLQEWTKAREERRPVSVEFRVQGADGRFRWVMSLGNPFIDSDGRLVKYYGTWTDIDEQRRTGEELKRAIRVKDEFISVASHELKTPITSMKLQAQMLSRNLKRFGYQALDPQQLEKLISLTNKQLDRLNRLVDDMLEISRIGAGRFTIQRAPVDLSLLAQEIVERYGERLPDGKPLVRLEAESGVTGNWDASRLEQVIDNLISNALKYGDGKPVRVRVGFAPDGQAEICVADQGIGIAADQQQRIFRRFERAVSSKHISGLGLGLYIVNTIVRLHQGEVLLESAPGKGAVFTVRLPLDAVR